MAAKAAAATLLAACVLHAIVTAPHPAAGSHKPQVAIVGGGIGGAAAAYFVRQLCGENVGIHVFESQHIGGRLRGMNFAGSTYEMGGSMVYEDNVYIRCIAGACAPASSRISCRCIVCACTTGATRCSRVGSQCRCVTGSWRMQWASTGSTRRPAPKQTARLSRCSTGRGAHRLERLVMAVSFLIVI